MGCAALDQAGPKVMLHADLYKENVLFDTSGAPVCIDPRGRRGTSRI
jgi:fructosamine-3-kinase